MRRDLLHWDKALKLAQTLAVEQIPEISIQYGQQLEFRDEIEPALKMFESALNITDSSGKSICPGLLFSIKKKLLFYLKYYSVFNGMYLYIHMFIYVYIYDLQNHQFLWR